MNILITPVDACTVSVRECGSPSGVSLWEVCAWGCERIITIFQPQKTTPLPVSSKLHFCCGAPSSDIAMRYCAALHHIWLLMKIFGSVTFLILCMVSAIQKKKPHIRGFLFRACAFGSQISEWEHMLIITWYTISNHWQLAFHEDLRLIWEILTNPLWQAWTEIISQNHKNILTKKKSVITETRLMSLCN